HDGHVVLQLRRVVCAGAPDRRVGIHGLAVVRAAAAEQIAAAPDRPAVGDLDPLSISVDRLGAARVVLAEHLRRRRTGRAPWTLALREETGAQHDGAGPRRQKRGWS